ncbi:MAG TPA: malate dehydrogenase, partial [bacterium]|nr:malate dehydrogenase [bacterium]
MSRPKISVVGAGSVGVACATELARREVGEIVLVDVSPDLPAGRALDLSQSGPIGGFHVPVTGTDDYEATAGSRVVVITAGTPRRPGMSREDLFSVNSRTIRAVTERAAGASPESVLILVTNPLDVMTCLAWKVSGFPKKRVMGQAGVLDSARLRGFIAEACGVSPLDVAAVTLGGHGDTMLPLTRYATVGGLPLETFLSEEQIRAVVDRT